MSSVGGGGGGDARVTTTGRLPAARPLWPTPQPLKNNEKNTMAMTTTTPASSLALALPCHLFLVP